ncbi:MAG: N-acetylmuramoyl-L-alanine amidase [Veillonella parvula]|uniref:N-acetylmuramoyl-L-alanine amidase n=1 Tax=Veillonella parvula TaxID=29466 RepID=A0A943A4C5_VEIPA|nr:N-acetylmuramoyl-L-alanine amidase [Veillonella parvula]MBS4894057.1 N-acetylmuramoyl-L-alanine amidase [Veillonella parvula]
MKIAVRRGHNFQAKGAVALLNEVVEANKVYKSVIRNLELAGHTVYDVTPNDCDVNSDLRYGVNRANSLNVDLFISIHFDKCYNSYNGHLGTGTWVSGFGGNAEKYAKNIVNSIANGTGLKNRGVKTNPKLYELRNTDMPAVIVEVCFCEATEDVRIYKEKGHDYIGKLISEGIHGNNINSSVPTPPPTESNSSQVSYKNFYESDETRTNAVLVGQGSIEVLDSECNIIPNRCIDNLDRLFVIGIYPSRNYIEVVYPSGNKKYHAYVNIKHYNRISFDHHMEYLNDEGITYIWWNSGDVNKTNHNEELKPYQQASPMYRENGWLRITFYRENGVPSDGYVRYEGKNKKNFYEEAKIKQGIVKVNSYLNVRDDIDGNIIGKVFNNEKVTIVWTETGWYYIEYDTSHGKKRGYVSAKYIEVI